MKKGLITAQAYQRFVKGHPWLNATDIKDRKSLPQRAGALQFGDTWWLYSPESFIKLRRLGPAMQGWMKNPKFNYINNADQFHAYFGNWLQNHLQTTLKNKISKLNLSHEDLCLRWIFSDNDFLPGLVIDVFGNHIVAQINSAPIELFWLQIRKHIENAFTSVTQKAAQITELRTASVREKEGLAIIQPEILPNPRVLNWNGLKFNMTPVGAQKTGAYFDQRDNHKLALKYALERKVKAAWDLCCYQGGFGLHLAKNGIRVIAVDQSQGALDVAVQNRDLNDIAATLFTTETADVFSWLQKQITLGTNTDMIILDPPSFVKSRTEVESAKKGYVELNTLALKALNAGGMLVSCVCSHHMTRNIYKDVLSESAQLAEKKIRIVDVKGPSPDHAALANFAEGEYLHAWYVEVLDSAL